MILTGPQIAIERNASQLTIEPFLPDNLKPCSYTYRLGPQLGVPNAQPDENGKTGFTTIDIPPEGYVLQPGRMYLGHTLEILGSDKFAMSLIGRNSLGRLGLFLQVSANLIHTGAKHQITLELVAAMPIRLYAGMNVGEISFWETKGELKTYDASGYTAHNGPTPSRLG